MEEEKEVEIKLEPQAQPVVVIPPQPQKRKRRPQVNTIFNSPISGKSIEMSKLPATWVCTSDVLLDGDYHGAVVVAYSEEEAMDAMRERFYKLGIGNDKELELLKIEGGDVFIFN